MILEYFIHSINIVTIKNKFNLQKIRELLMSVMDYPSKWKRNTLMKINYLFKIFMKYLNNSS